MYDVFSLDLFVLDPSWAPAPVDLWTFPGTPLDLPGPLGLPQTSSGETLIQKALAGSRIKAARRIRQNSRIFLAAFVLDPSWSSTIALHRPLCPWTL